MAGEPVERCSPALATGNMSQNHSETQLHTHQNSHLSKNPKPEDNQCWWDKVKLESSHNVGGVTHGPAIPLLGTKP